MNISKLNPIGYETKTEKGNTYKKSNLGKSMGTALFATTSALTYTTKNPIAKAFTTSAILDTIEELAKIKISSKQKPFILGLCAVLDILGGLWMGNEVDKYINKKRAAKADITQEIDTKA